MAQLKKRSASLLLTLLMLFSMTANAWAADSAAAADALSDTAAYIVKTVPTPQVGSTGGEWAVLGLARGGCAVPAAYYQSYYANVEQYVKTHNSVLHDKKYTEYSRVITALAAIGRDARNVAGYDLTIPLGDYDKTVWQRLNGPIWALIALDSRDYPMPQNTAAKTQATRQMYVDYILNAQMADGGWSFSDGADAQTDPDMTAMALQALAKYQSQPAVKAATDKALARMSELQNADGGFSSWGTANSESCAQMIVALGELGISLGDSRFVKNGKTLLDSLLTFYLPGKGFAHTNDSSETNQMATEQALYALAAAQRAAQGRNSLYRMGDAVSAAADDTAGEGLPGKHADVKAQPVAAAGKTFSDIAAHENRAAIEALASRGIINGYDGTHFGPDQTMTRAQFAAIMVRGLGLPTTTADKFTDVRPTDWFASYVGAAYAYGIVNGTSASAFTPNGTITRQEAAVMAARAAKLCGMDDTLSDAAVRDTLAQFGDYVTVSPWAREGLAFCYDSGILDASALNIQPKTAIKRCEIAQMLYHMLSSAKLL